MKKALQSKYDNNEQWQTFYGFTGGVCLLLLIGYYFFKGPTEEFFMGALIAIVPVGAFIKLTIENTLLKKFL